MIRGITWQIRDDNGASPYLHIRSEEPLRTFHSSVLNGGFGFHRNLVNRQVPKSYNYDDPAAEVGSFLSDQGVDPSDTCAMLTAAFVLDMGLAEAEHTWEEDGGPASLRVAAWVTAGLGNASRAGDGQPMDRLYPGTVNTIILADGRLTDAAMANAIITATEAKTAVFQDLDIRVQATGRLATGTTTDAVLIAATGRSRRDFRYAGSATVLGHLIGRTVYDAAYSACRRYLEQYKGSVR